MGGQTPYEIDRLRGIRNGKGIGRLPVQHQVALVDRANKLYEKLLALDPRPRKAAQIPDPDTHPELHRELHDLIDLRPGTRGRPRGSKILPSGKGPTEMGQALYNKHLQNQRSNNEWEAVYKPDRIKQIKYHYEQNGAPIDDDAAEELYQQEKHQGIPATTERLPVEWTRDTWPTEHVQGEGERLAATKRKPAKKKPRKPEEVWYDVHKHPEGTPGGMGKSPEHHLRNRGWSPYEIHGAASKTIQYHNPSFPDFMVSYGGG